MKISLGAKTLAVPCPVWIVGAYDEDDKPNVMLAAWGGICCSEPPCIAVSLRPSRYTYECIMERKAFTVSVANARYAAECDYFGMASGRDVNKFAATGLTPVRSGVVDAPYVAELPVVIECKLAAVNELGVHHQLVGEIVDVKVDEGMDLDGKAVDVEKAQPLIFTFGARKYHGVGKHVGNAFDMGKRFLGK